MARLILFNKPYGVLSQFTDAKSPIAARDALGLSSTCRGSTPQAGSTATARGCCCSPMTARLQARIADPKHKLDKTYLVQVEGAPTEDDLAPLRRGLRLKDGPTRPAEARLIDPPDLWPRDPPVRFRKSVPDRWLELTITRRPQPAGAADDGGDRLSRPSAGALAGRRLGARRARAGRMARG